MATLGDITMNFEMLTMSFAVDGKQYMLRGECFDMQGNTLNFLTVNIRIGMSNINSLMQHCGFMLQQNHSLV